VAESYSEDVEGSVWYTKSFSQGVLSYSLCNSVSGARLLTGIVVEQLLSGTECDETRQP